MSVAREADDSIAVVEVESMLREGTASQPGTRRWNDYVAADLGYRNYWYPAAWSRDVPEGGFLGVTVLGENILISRQDGKIAAVRDRCAHRGVRFSAKPECYKNGTVTCWYHTWTYDMETGRLRDIPMSPGSAIVGRVSIRAYRVQEAQGLVFVFIGDGDPPPLAHDVPPGFLDEDRLCLGERRLVKSNWRLGIENGFDLTHIWMHRHSVLFTEINVGPPMAMTTTEGRRTVIADAESEPKGVRLNFAAYMPSAEAYLEGERIYGKPFRGDETHLGNEHSVWMPGVLKVDPMPDPSIVQYEWYVPVDAHSHMYFQILAGHVTSESDAQAYRLEYENKWKPLSIFGFNDDDVWAREATEEFYASGDGWYRERLYPPDANLVEWRRFASAHHRGIQTIEHTKA